MAETQASKLNIFLSVKSNAQNIGFHFQFTNVCFVHKHLVLLEPKMTIFWSILLKRHVWNAIDT